MGKARKVRLCHAGPYSCTFLRQWRPAGPKEAKDPARDINRDGCRRAFHSTHLTSRTTTRESMTSISIDHEHGIIVNASATHAVVAHLAVLANILQRADYAAKHSTIYGRMTQVEIATLRAAHYYMAKAGQAAVNEDAIRLVELERNATTKRKR